MKGPPPGSTAFGLFRHPPRGGTAGGRGDPGHGGHAHGLLRGLLGVPVLELAAYGCSGAERSDGPCSPIPSGRAEKRRAWGGRGHRRMAALRALTRCGCLSGAPFGARSEFRSAAPRPSIAGCPQRSEGTRQAGSPFLCLLSFGEAKESRCAAGRTSRPAAPPKRYAFNSCLRPPRLAKTAIQLKNWWPAVRRAKRIPACGAPQKGRIGSNIQGARQTASTGSARTEHVAHTAQENPSQIKP